MQRLIDANVFCRELLADTSHPKYLVAVQSLSLGGCVRDYVFPEIVYEFLASVRKSLARQQAIALGELPKFEANPRVYIRNTTPPSGWKKEAYQKLSNRISVLLSDYANVELEDPERHGTAMAIAIQTGHDWVDCLLLAEEKLGHGVTVSLDKDISKGRKGVSAMTLT